MHGASRYSRHAYVREAKTANLLGALALALTDRIHEVGDSSTGLGPCGPAALVTLLDRPGASVDLLRGALGRSQSAATRVVDRLVEAELAERRPGRDGRSLALHLTPHGRDAAGRVRSGRESAMRRALVPLDQAELRLLAALLGKVLAGLTGDRFCARSICRLCERGACERAGGCPVANAAELAEWNLR